MTTQEIRYKLLGLHTWFRGLGRWETDGRIGSEGLKLYIELNSPYCIGTEHILLSSVCHQSLVFPH
jgi:hypothetical protein